MADVDLNLKSAAASAKKRHLDLSNILHEAEMNAEGLGTMCHALACSDNYGNGEQMLFRSLSKLVSELTAQIGEAKALAEGA